SEWLYFLNGRLVYLYCTLEIGHILKSTHPIRSRSLGIIAIIDNPLRQIDAFPQRSASHFMANLPELRDLFAQFIPRCVTVFRGVCQAFIQTMNEAVNLLRHGVQRVFVPHRSAHYIKNCFEKLSLIWRQGLLDR